MRGQRVAFVRLAGKQACQSSLQYLGPGLQYLAHLIIIFSLDGKELN